MATLRASLQAEIATLEQSLASKKSALETLGSKAGNFLDLEVAALREAIRAIGPHVFATRAPVLGPAIAAVAAPSVAVAAAPDAAHGAIDRLMQFVTGKPAAAPAVPVVEAVAAAPAAPVPPSPAPAAGDGM